MRVWVLATYAAFGRMDLPIRQSVTIIFVWGPQNLWFDRVGGLVARLRLFALRDDDKPCDARGFKEDLAIQLDLHPPHAKTPKARAKKKRCPASTIFASALPQ